MSNAPAHKPAPNSRIVAAESPRRSRSTGRTTPSVVPAVGAGALTGSGRSTLLDMLDDVLGGRGRRRRRGVRLEPVGDLPGPGYEGMQQVADQPFARILVISHAERDGA